jgi:hypothetical protein
MLGVLICVVLIAALVQFVYYCRSSLASARKAGLSDNVPELGRVESEALAAEDFPRLLELVYLCPERSAGRTELRAVRAYYNLLRSVENRCGSLIPSVALWAKLERESCSYFAAVVLDRSISSSREMFSPNRAANL